MSEGGHRAAKRFDDLDLGGGIGHMVRPTHNMGDTHFCVINDRSQSVKNLTVATDQNGV